MDWRKTLNRKNGRENSQQSKKSFNIKFKKGSIYISYIKKQTLKVIEWNFSRFASDILVMAKQNIILIFSSVPIVFAIFLMLAINSNTDSKDVTRQPGIGGIGELVDVRTHEDTHSEADEARKDQLLGAEDLGNKPDVTENITVSKRIYKVKEGDNLSSISKTFNVSVEAIAGSSKIRMIDRLQIGQTLQIPDKEGFFYSIKKGERLASIISKYNVSYDKFLKENPGLPTDLLEVGDEIFLPEAKPDDIIRSWMIPVASHYITSGYGWRKYPSKAFHKGLDLMARYVPVRAAKNGRVSYSGWLGGYGKVIVVVHEGGYKSLYAHLSELYVRPGSYVMQGTVIGKSGNTGYSFGAHLHFEVTHYGKSINPLNVLTGLRYYRRS
jgi:murein DD-endopeptidase MepM/ murein hydrolase activator NlpD